MVPEPQLARPLKDPKNGPPPPNMKALLHWANLGIIREFHFLDPLGGQGCRSRLEVSKFRN